MRGAVVEDRLGGAADLEHHRVAVQLLVHGADRELAHAEAAVLGRDVDRPEPALARLGLQLRPQRPFDVALAQELLLQRRQPLLAELARDLHQPADVRRQLEVHLYASLSVLTSPPQIGGGLEDGADRVERAVGVALEGVDHAVEPDPQLDQRRQVELGSPIQRATATKSSCR